MDPILFAKSTAMADAFTMLLAIHQGPEQRTPEQGRIYKRSMIHNQNTIMQFALRDEKLNAIRWVCAEFFQWQGYFYVYQLDDAQMYQYLPKRLRHVQQGFQYEKFVRDFGNKALFYTVDEIEKAALWALDYLKDGTTPPLKTQEQVQTQIERVLKFQRIHNPSGRISMSSADLAALIAKGQ